MIEFKAELRKFDKKGEKTGWTYIDIDQKLAQKLKPNHKKAFRVKGKLDAYTFKAVSLIPMGEGDFIMAINATMRRAIKKQKGETVMVQLEEDQSEFILSPDLMACLKDESKALSFFKSLAGSHQKYFSNWIESAKTEGTKTKRIAQAIEALQNKMGYAEMIRANKVKKDLF